MKATKRQIKFWKGVVLIKILSKLAKDGTFMSLCELEAFLKNYADLEIDRSVTELERYEMEGLLTYSLQFAESIGLVILFPSDWRNEWKEYDEKYLKYFKTN